ncbi:MAG TPA: DUF3300 domain-containing protein, partial [Candidatus Angelobacter sp.]
MKTIGSFRFPDPLRGVIGIACAAALLVSAYSLAYAQQDHPLAGAAANEEAPPIPADQLDSLVAPIALYPDPLLAQTLAASTYPLEVIQLEQWYANNKYLKDKALADAVAKQPWDPSVQALVAFPDVVQRMAGNIQWTTDLGNAFLAQQSDVMDAVQRMRAKAQGKGNLNTNAQQKVETQTVEGGEQAIVIEQANPDLVYVPSYDPQMVYGAPSPVYPYYPYTYPGYYAGMGLAFGTGLVLGGAWANNWGNCDWKHGDVNINNNNSFNRNTNRTVNRGTGGQGNAWQHNPQHRGNAPYGNKQTANKYGGTARGEAGTLGAGTRGSAGGGARPGGGTGALPGGSGIGGGNRTGGGGAQNLGASNRPGSGVGAGNISGSNRPSGGAGASRAGGGAAGMPANSGAAANSIGNRSVSSGSGFGSSSNAFGGGGFNGSSARSASTRGGSSI